MLLKDLKPLIPELKSTKLKLQKTEAFKKAALKKEASAAQTASSPAVPSTLTAVSAPVTATEAEVVPITQLEQVRSLIGDVLTEVVVSNNDTLKKDISKSVTTDVIREMDFLFQAKERQEEEHFRKLDTLIRQQQASRKEAAREHPLGRLKSMFNHC